MESSSTTSNDNKSLVLRVAVGSSNPTKINAVLKAFRACLDRKQQQQQHDADNNNNNNSSNQDNYKHFHVSIELEGFNVDSGVHRQPIGDGMTLQGAKNRAKKAYLEFKKKNGQFPHMAVGLEGGVECIDTAASSGRSLFGGGGGMGNQESNHSQSSHWSGGGGSAGVEEEQNEEQPAAEPNNSNGGGHGGTNTDATTTTLYCMAWMAIYGKRQAMTVDIFASSETSSYYGDKKPYFGLAKTAQFPLPPRITQLIVEQNMELGEADNAVFRGDTAAANTIKTTGASSSSYPSSWGTVGKLTDGLIDREEYYQHALTLALMPWIRPELYP